MIAACTVAELQAAGGILAVEAGARELVVVLTAEGVFAVDRACPHESYRLDEGIVANGEITCPAHGWRFDLRSGACRTAGTDTRAYAVEVRDGTVLVETAVAATPTELALATELVLGALETGRPALAARRTARLLALGEAPDRVGLLLARYGATHADAGLDPETAMVADALAIAAHVAPATLRSVLSDVAAAIAERLARASPRFGPEPATSFAWAAGPSATLTALVGDGDPDECEAVVAGMVAAGVATAEIVAGLARGVAARGGDDPWVLIVLERAGRLATGLGDEAARVVLPVAAYGCALDDGRRRTPLPYADPAAVIEAAASAIAGFDLAEDAGHGGRSLLGCALALVHAEAARSTGADAGLARVLLNRSRSHGCEAASVDGSFDSALADGAAETARGLAVCLAAARVALESDGPLVRAGVLRLLTTRRRERSLLL